MNKNRKKLVTFVLALLLIALFSNSTLAYYTVRGTATNVVTSGSIRLEIKEKDKDGNDFPRDGVIVIPGDIVTKRVSVKNVCDHPFWLRVALVKGSSQEKLSADDVLQILDINLTNWEKQGEYYYYREILQPDEETEPLFTQVEIAGDKVDQHDIGTALTITVKAEAVQSEHNPAGNAWEASGWPAA